MKIGDVNFNIEYDELNDLLTDITDEFTLDGYDLVYDIDSSLQSSLIHQDNKSFVITFSEKGESFFDLNVLYYLEPKIWELIRQIDSQLRSHDLYISASDFGESDIYYELVVSELGHTPKYKEKYMYAVKEDVNIKIKRFKDI